MSLVERGEFDACLAFHRGRVSQHENTVLARSPVPDKGIDLSRGRARGVTGYEIERQSLERQRAIMTARAKELEDHIRRLGGVQATELAYGSDERPTIRAIQWHVCAYSSTMRVDLLSIRRTAAIVKVPPYRNDVIENDDLGELAGNRPQVRRAGSHHGFACREENRAVATMVAASGEAGR